VLVAAFALRAWVDFLLILVVTAFVLVAEIFNSAIERCATSSRRGTTRRSR